MKFSVVNFLGVKNATVETKHITMIAGTNYSGKTSFLRAAQAALTGQIIPIDGLPKTSAGRLIHGGTAAAEIFTTEESGQTRTTYPEAKRESTGSPVEISAHAAGMESIVDVPARDRLKSVSQMLKSEPMADELRKILADAGIPNADNIIKSVAMGWDSAHKQYQELGARLKGSWEQITGQRYGDKKSAEWLPAAWQTDLQSTSEAALAETLTHENEWLETAISHEAVSAQEIERLTKSSGMLPGLISERDFLTAELKGLQKNRDEIRAGMDNLPRAEQPVSQPCPACNAALCIVGGKIQVVTVVSAEEIKNRAEAISACKKSLELITLEITTRQTKIINLAGMIQTAEADKKTLSEAKSGDGTEAQKIMDCRIRVKSAQDRLNAFQQKQNATAKYTEVQNNQTVIDLLAPAGIRAQFLTKKLSTLNDTLIKISEQAGWRHVSLRQDMGISLAGTPYMLCSGAEKWMIRIVIQIAFAQISGDKIVIVDDADTIVTPADRNGFFKMMRSITGIEFIIGMAYGKETDAPDLSKIGGVTYWMEGGECK
jgi:hypothetical protein